MQPSRQDCRPLTSIINSGTTLLIDGSVDSPSGSTHACRSSPKIALLARICWVWRVTYSGARCGAVLAAVPHYRIATVRMVTPPVPFPLRAPEESTGTTAAPKSAVNTRQSQGSGRQQFCVPTLTTAAAVAVAVAASSAPASMAPEVAPAPTTVWISSMKSTTRPALSVTSLITAFSRSSNSPRYLAPALA